MSKKVCCTCLHTICQSCLSDIAPKNALKIFCPIDKQELPLPMGGIAMLPTDYRILRLVEAKSGQIKKERTERKPRERKATSERSERRKSKNTDEDSPPPLEEQEQRMKKQAQEMTEKLRKLLEEKEKELFKKIDEAIEREKRSLMNGRAENGDKKPPAIFLLDLTPSRKIIQSIKEEGLATIQGNRKAPTLLSDLNTSGITPIASIKNTAPNVSYRDAAEVIRSLKVPLQFKSFFNPGAVASSADGHLAVTDYGNECVWLFNPDGSFNCQVSYVRRTSSGIMRHFSTLLLCVSNWCTSVIVIVHVIFDINLIIILIACCCRHHYCQKPIGWTPIIVTIVIIMIIVVINVIATITTFIRLVIIIMTVQCSTLGDDQFPLYLIIFYFFKVGQDGDVTMECPDGIFFLPNNNIVVSDGPLDGAQSIQLFDISGKFIRCLAEVDDDDDLSFSSIFIDADERILVACNGLRPCIQVYSKDGEEYSLEMELGEDQLVSPEKAIFYNGKFFVSDSDSKKNITMIKVFDAEGAFETSFDEDKYSLGQRDNMGIDIVYPIKITFDSSNNTLLAYHGIPREIRVLRLDGSQVSSMKTVSGARDIALTKDRQIVATCGQESILSRSVQILKFNGQ